MKITKAAIAAAGHGTRFSPLSHVVPKEMVPVNRQPLIDRAIEELAMCGIRDITVIISPEKAAIRDFLGGPHCHATRSGVKICYAVQEEALGLGHAVAQAGESIGDEPFVLVLPDDIFELSEKNVTAMIEICERYGGSTIAVGTVSDEEVSRYGIIDGTPMGNRIHRVRALVEKPALIDAPSHLAIFGRYVLDPAVFDILAATPRGKNGEIQLTDALNVLAQQQPMFAYEYTGNRYDCGTLKSWGETNVCLGVPKKEITDYFTSMTGTPYPEQD